MAALCGNKKLDVRDAIVDDNANQEANIVISFVFFMCDRFCIKN